MVFTAVTYFTYSVPGVTYKKIKSVLEIVEWNRFRRLEEKLTDSLYYTERVPYSNEVFVEFY